MIFEIFKLREFVLREEANRSNIAKNRRIFRHKTVKEKPEESKEIDTGIRILIAYFVYNFGEDYIHKILKEPAFKTGKSHIILYESGKTLHYFCICHSPE